MDKLTLATANHIIEKALAHARHRQLAPLAIVVLDAAGYPLALQREDGAAMLRPQIAHAKAWGAVMMGMPSRALGSIAAERPAFMHTLTTLAEGKVVPVPGGVLIRSHGGCVLGAVGVSGDLSDEDEACAIVGIQGAVLLADPGVAA